MTERSAKLKQYRKSWQEHEFVPHPLLKNRHLMTIVPGFLPRRKLNKFCKSGTSRLFQINNDAKLLGHCHFQEKKAPTVIILHGLEGSSESSHVQGIGFKCFQNGFNVLRLNMRNCGGSMQHAKTLYNAGMWQDLRAVMEILHKEERLDEFILAGYSLGGNLILNTVAHHEVSQGYRIRAACAVSPSIDLAHAVKAIEEPQNKIYQDWFLRTLKKKILAKSQQFPDIYNPEGLDEVLTIREFDDRFTAPYGGYGNADRYYRESSSHGRLKQIATPVLVIAAEDDPLVPVDSFNGIEEKNPNIELLITKYGGHGGFLQSRVETESHFDHFWAENRVVAYIREVSSL